MVSVVTGSKVLEAPPASVTLLNVATVLAPFFKVSVWPLNDALVNGMLLSAMLSPSLSCARATLLVVPIVVMATLLAAALVPLP